MNTLLDLNIHTKIDKREGEWDTKGDGEEESKIENE